jgi:hypothetical protein
MLDRAISAELVRRSSEAPQLYEFCHVLIRDHLYETQSALEVARCHDRLAVWLESRALSPSTSSSAVIAFHSGASLPLGDPERALHWSRHAARFATERYAYDEACSQLERALALLDAAPKPPAPESRCELLLDLSEARLRAGSRVSAEQSCGEAVAIARELGASALLARAAFALVPGFFSIETALYDDYLIELLEDAIEATSPEDARLRARLLGRLATALYWSPDVARREALSTEAVRLASVDSDPETAAYALHARHCSLWGPENLAERIDLAKEAVSLSEVSGDQEASLLYRTILITDLAEAGSFGQVDQEIRCYEETAAELQQAQSTWLSSMFRGMQALLQGRFGNVPELISEVQVIAQHLRSNDAENAWAGQTLFAMFEAGHGESMLKLLREHISNHPRVLLFQSVPPWVAAELGHTTDAQRDLNRFAEASFESVPRDMNWLGTISFLALAAAELRDVSAAEQLSDLLEPFQDRFALLGHATVSLGAVASHLGRLAAVLDDWDRAEVLFARGRALNEGAGASPWLARALFDEARERVLRRDWADVHQLLGEASRMSRNLGMDHLSSRVSKLSHEAA